MLKRIRDWFNADGGIAELQPRETDLTIRYQITPKPHGRWALQRTHFRLGYQSIITEWISIAEYDTPEAAKADFIHLFGTAPIPLDA